METIGKIRRLYYVQGKGYKTIARELRLSKNTVKKALQQGVTKTQYQCTHKKYRVLGNYVDRLRKRLEEDRRCTPKTGQLNKRVFYPLGWEYNFNNSGEYKWERFAGNTAVKQN